MKIVVSDNQFPIPILGASAGVFSLATAHIASILLNFKEDITVIRTRFRQKDWKICGRRIEWNKLPTASACGKGVRYGHIFITSNCVQLMLRFVRISVLKLCM